MSKSFRKEEAPDPNGTIYVKERILDACQMSLGYRKGKGGIWERQKAVVGRLWEWYNERGEECGEAEQEEAPMMFDQEGAHLLNQVPGELGLEAEAIET